MANEIKIAKEVAQIILSCVPDIDLIFPFGTKITKEFSHIEIDE